MGDRPFVSECGHEPRNGERENQAEGEGKESKKRELFTEKLVMEIIGGLIGVEEEKALV